VAVEETRQQATFPYIPHQAVPYSYVAHNGNLLKIGELYFQVQ